eukprot:TRINITY_DN1585_c0_g1_i4.p1 TRINITY_DN1585_c0_g1~~TRINITY_DN1585_c0_g1_i4.p1  ORF type:complete len:209 (+),score=65.16 TRINITY_DN1585_c0_g1_i4:181-807(+)
MAAELAQKIIDATFERLDSDKDGKITKEDLANYASDPTFGKDFLEDLNKAVPTDTATMDPDKGSKFLYVIGSFIYADKDNDKKLSFEEAKSLVTDVHSLKGKPAPAEEKIKGEFDSSDKNKDGYLTFDEFEKFFKLPKKLSKIASKSGKVFKKEPKEEAKKEEAKKEEAKKEEAKKEEAKKEEPKKEEPKKEEPKKEEAKKQYQPYLT